MAVIARVTPVRARRQQLLLSPCLVSLCLSGTTSYPFTWATRFFCLTHISGYAASVTVAVPHCAVARGNVASSLRTHNCVSASSRTLFQITGEDVCLPILGPKCSRHLFLSSFSFSPSAVSAVCARGTSGLAPTLPVATVTSAPTSLFAFAQSPLFCGHSSTVLRHSALTRIWFASSSFLSAAHRVTALTAASPPSSAAAPLAVCAALWYSGSASLFKNSVPRVPAAAALFPPAIVSAHHRCLAPSRLSPPRQAHFSAETTISALDFSPFPLKVPSYFISSFAPFLMPHTSIKMAPAGKTDDATFSNEAFKEEKSSLAVDSPAAVQQPPAAEDAKLERSSLSQKRALETADSELYELLRMEKKRQIDGLELVASENFTSQAVQECLGSCLTNKYSEGYPGARYYGGNDVIDKVESLCQRRALECFGLKAEEWAVNVQPYSGSPANLAVYTGLLQPHDRIMGLDLPAGGHLTHGFYTAKKRVSATSIFFESLPYGVNKDTGLIDYDELRKLAQLFRPKLIICGHSAYPRDLDYSMFRNIADSVGAMLMCDMAHTSGLIAAGLLASPFQYCDVVTTTTHKTLRGPRSGMIFAHKHRLADAAERINGAVFPALQGGPHQNNIAAVACQLKEVGSDSWRKYAKQVIQNSKALAKRLIELGHTVVTGGTDNHLLVVDLRADGITGAKMQLCCDEAYITLNKNCVPGDTGAANPSGVRIGAPALTSRGMKEEDFEQIGTWLHDVIAVAREIQETHGKKIIDFKKGVPHHPRLKDIREQVVAFARKFPIPGSGDI